MGPQLFFVLFLLATVLIGAGIVLFFTLKTKSSPETQVSPHEIKQYFEDVPLKSAIQSLKQKLSRTFRCPKCQEKRYECLPFDEDLYEVYCLSCGFKKLYDVDFMAGSDRPTKKSKSPWPKKWLKDSKDQPCRDCQGQEYSTFRLAMEVPYKIGNFGNSKLLVLYLNVCKSCSLVNLYNQMRFEWH